MLVAILSSASSTGDFVRERREVLGALPAAVRARELVDAESVAASSTVPGARQLTGRRRGRR